jgi:hypothetical protein
MKAAPPEVSDESSPVIEGEEPSAKAADEIVVRRDASCPSGATSPAAPRARERESPGVNLWGSFVCVSFAAPAVKGLANVRSPPAVAAASTAAEEIWPAPASVGRPAPVSAPSVLGAVPGAMAALNVRSWTESIWILGLK